jgi:C-terminal processing protease CtpA/Prc
MRHPSLEYRLLAAFRAWNVIEHFYPYRQLLDTAWNEVLPRVIADFEGAVDLAGYGRAAARLAVRIGDSHSYVSGPAYAAGVSGEGYPPIRVRLVEGKPVVTAVFDSAAGVAVGDIVETVGGEPAAAVLARTGSWLSASTPQSRMDQASLTFMNGSVGSTVQLGLRDRSGRTRTVALERRREDFSTLYHRERTGEIIRLLPGNVGYVDLDRLTLDMVDSMFDRLARTRAIVFDMRGYPNGTIWAIAPRLTDSTRSVARLETPLVGHPTPAPATSTFYQTVDPAPPARRYRGRVVVLIDERTVSQAEHTGLYLRATSGALLVGSPTAGVNGEVATIALPGGLTIGFTAQAVMHPDGRPLQRVGLAADVEVRPTIAGIRAGRDEVLDAALRIAREREW